MARMERSFRRAFWLLSRKLLLTIPRRRAELRRPAFSRPGSTSCDISKLRRDQAAVSYTSTARKLPKSASSLSSMSPSRRFRAPDHDARRRERNFERSPSVIPGLTTAVKYARDVFPPQSIGFGARNHIRVYDVDNTGSLSVRVRVTNAALLAYGPFAEYQVLSRHGTASTRAIPTMSRHADPPVRALDVS